MSYHYTDNVLKKVNKKKSKYYNNKQKNKFKRKSQLGTELMSFRKN